jgi:hypothetical protein
MTMLTNGSTRTGTGWRTGYVVGALINAALLIGINIWPGWTVVPFLTETTPLILPWVNASLIVAVVANALYLVADPRWLRAVGSIGTSAVGLLATVRTWQVFPFDFGESAVDWALLMRIALVLGMVGGAVAIVVGLVALSRAIADLDARR